MLDIAMVTSKQYLVIFQMFSEKTTLNLINLRLSGPKLVQAETMKIKQIHPYMQQVINKNGAGFKIKHQLLLEKTIQKPGLFINDDSSNISIDGTSSFGFAATPNTIDFIPNQQEVYVTNWTASKRRKHLICKWLLVFVAIILIMDVFATLIVNVYQENEANNSVAIRNSANVNYYSNRLFYINYKMKNLNKNLKYFNNAFNTLTQWQNTVNIEMTKIKNLTIHPSFKYLELINLKVQEALNMYDADKIGMIDYALESAGGYITSTPDTIPLPGQYSYDLLGVITMRNPSNPRLLIQPGTIPGQCFAFKGSIGRIRIRLAHIVNITALTIEHTYPALVSDGGSAPKNVKIYGLQTADSWRGDELGAFVYKLGGKVLQTFNVNSLKIYQHVEVMILTNHGNVDYTCVYRIRVHGDRVG